MNYIYKITNLINNKIYIGQTNDPSLRWSQHKSNAKYKRGDQVITRALIKHGVENFTFEIICTCLTQEDIDQIEFLIINQNDSRNPIKGYNVDAGGNTTPRTPEVLKKISEGLKKHYETNDGWLKGGLLTEEWKKNISKASMGKAGTNTGKTFSEEWKNKISKANIGRKLSAETIKKQSESHLGKIPPNRKLTFEQAEEIRCIYNTTKISQKELGKEFGLSQATINNIINNVTYKKV